MLSAVVAVVVAPCYLRLIRKWFACPPASFAACVNPVLYQTQLLTNWQNSHPALEPLVAQITAAPEITVPLAIPHRTQQANLPDEIKALVLGTELLATEALLTDEEIGTLQALFANESDQQAIARLRDDSLSRGLTTTKLTLRSRRGSAQPSDRKTILPLES